MGDAYLMYTQKERQPPASMQGVVVEKALIHPLNTHGGSLSTSDTGCTNTPFHKILDMRAFMTKYCVEYLSTVKRGKESCSGYCGNLLFLRRS